MVAVTFSASTGHLLASPRLYGWTSDAEVRTLDVPGLGDPIAAGLVRNPDVIAVAAGRGAQLTVDGRVVSAFGLDNERGVVNPDLVEGGAPRHDDDIVLGTQTLRDIGKQVGDEVDVSDAGARTRMRVVGRALFEDAGDTRGELGQGAQITFAGLRKLEPTAAVGVIRVRFAPGTDKTADVDQLRADVLPLPVDTAEPPTTITSFGRDNNLPVIVAGIMLVIATAVLVNAMVTSVRRRRHDFRDPANPRLYPSPAHDDGRRASDDLRVHRVPGRHPPRAARRSLGVVGRRERARDPRRNPHRRRRARGAPARRSSCSRTSWPSSPAGSPGTPNRRHHCVRSNTQRHSSMGAPSMPTRWSSSTARLLGAPMPVWLCNALGFVANSVRPSADTVETGVHRAMRGNRGPADVKAEEMIWLVLWCGSGAIVGWTIGHFQGRPWLGGVLGMFCGAFGWVMLLGAEPRTRATGSLADASTSASTAEDAGLAAVVPLSPISWVAPANLGHSIPTP